MNNWREKKAAIPETTANSVDAGAPGSGHARAEPFFIALALSHNARKRDCARRSLRAALGIDDRFSPAARLARRGVCARQHLDGGDGGRTPRAWRLDRPRPEPHRVPGSALASEAWLLSGDGAA